MIGAKKPLQLGSLMTNAPKEDKTMKKTWFRRGAVIVVALMLLFSCVISAAAADFIPKVTVENTDASTITVTVEESNTSILQEKKPNLMVACTFPAASVIHEGSTVPSTLKDGKISFEVAEGGVYVIRAAAVSGGNDNNGGNSDSSGNSGGLSGGNTLVESPKTGDVGMMCYAAMSVLSATGLLLHKRTKIDT